MARIKRPVNPALVAYHQAQEDAPTSRPRTRSANTAERQLHDASIVDKDLKYVSLRPDVLWTRETPELRVARFRREFAEEQARVRAEIEARRNGGGRLTRPLWMGGEVVVQNGGLDGDDGSSQDLDSDSDTDWFCAPRQTSYMAKGSTKRILRPRKLQTNYSVKAEEEVGKDADSDSSLSGVDEEVLARGMDGNNDDLEIVQDPSDDGGSMAASPSSPDAEVLVRGILDNINLLLRAGESVQDRAGNDCSTPLQSPSPSHASSVNSDVAGGQGQGHVAVSDGAPGPSPVSPPGIAFMSALIAAATNTARDANTNTPADGDPDSVLPAVAEDFDWYA